MLFPWLFDLIWGVWQVPSTDYIYCHFYAKLFIFPLIFVVVLLPSVLLLCYFVLFDIFCELLWRSVDRMQDKNVLVNFKH